MRNASVRPTLLALLLTLLIVLAACGQNGGSSGREGDGDGASGTTSEPPPEGGPGLGPSFSPPPPSDEEQVEEEEASSNEVVVGPAFVDPRIFTFGEVPVGGSSEEVLVTVRNGQQEGVVVTAIEIGGAAPQDFAIAETGCLPNVELVRHATCEIALVFTPTDVGESLAVLSITVSGGMGRQVRLLGVGTS